MKYSPERVVEHGLVEVAGHAAEQVVWVAEEQVEAELEAEELQRTEAV